MNRISALLWKEIRLFLTDKKALLITFMVPIAIASFFGSVLGSTDSSGGSAKKIDVLVADNDGSAVTKKIIEGMKADSMASPVVSSEADARGRVAAGKSAVAIIFPKGFGATAPQAMFSGEPPVVELIYDPTHSMEFQAVQGALMQVAMREINRNAFSPGQSYSGQLDQIRDSDMPEADKAKYRALFADLQKLPASSPSTGGGSGPQQPFKLNAHAQTAPENTDVKWSSMAHTFAGMAVQGVLFFGIDAAMGLLRDRRLGIWKRVVASPVSLPEILLGKALATALLGALVLSGVLAFGMLVFGIRVLGSWIGLLAVVVATSLMVSAFGLMVASLGRTESQSRGFSILAVLMMTMLGGGWFPAFLMPGWVQTVSFFVPVRWAMDGFDAMMWRGQPLSMVAAPVGGLLGFTLVFALVAWLRFRVIVRSAT